jgi:hypothetical protein
MVRFLLCLTAVISVSPMLRASISYTTSGSSITQNFDTLSNSGDTNAWANDSTLTGWHLFNRFGDALGSYAANHGTSANARFYSYGNLSSAERALGGVGGQSDYFSNPASNTVAGYLAFAAINNTGVLLQSINVGFQGEQWRNGGEAAAHTMRFQYGFGSTFSSVSSWNTPGGSFDWSSPIFSTTAGATDGNTAGLVANLGGTINASWNAGDTLWLRWVETNDTGSDHGLAIDNFSMTANITAVPEPTSLAFAIGLMGVAGCYLARKRDSIRLG